MKQHLILPILAALLCVTACSKQNNPASVPDDSQSVQTTETSDLSGDSENSGKDSSDASQKSENPGNSQASPDDSIQTSHNAESPDNDSDNAAEVRKNSAFPDADPNAVNFSDGDFSFAHVVTDDSESAEGVLSVEEVDGNFMLRFTDTGTTKDNLDVMVQKIRIDVGALLSPDQLESVHSIGFDIYGIAEEDWFVNDDGENVRVPGWIGGGGGTMAADGKWYSFSDFAADGINEYDLERSDAYRVNFKFLLASAGKCWSSEMEDVNFLIMRWGMQNRSGMYIDNITFYDEEGNSMPLHKQ